MFLSSRNAVSSADDNWYSIIDVMITAFVEDVCVMRSKWLGFTRRCMVECLVGHNIVPLCVRHVQAQKSSLWVYEKLSPVDHDEHIFTFDLVGGNSGIAVGYKSAVQVCIHIQAVSSLQTITAQLLLVWCRSMPRRNYITIFLYLKSHSCIPMGYMVGHQVIVHLASRLYCRCTFEFWITYLPLIKSFFGFYSL